MTKMMILNIRMVMSMKKDCKDVYKRQALTYEKFYGGVSNAEQLMYKKSCVYSKSKEGKLKSVSYTHLFVVHCCFSGDSLELCLHRNGR